jgi:two-component system response regulator DesR
VSAPIRLLVADDEEMTRTALVALLGLEPDIRVVAECADGGRAAAAAEAERPDVALLDLEMPVLDGVAVCARLAGLPTRAIVVTRHARPGVLRRALAAGAAGFLPKSTAAQDVADVVRRVHAGRRYVDPDIAAMALTEADCPLTGRELDVLRAARSGGTVADIAAEVHLAQGTVRNYLSSAMTTLDARTRHEAARRAWEEGWI